MGRKEAPTHCQDPECGAPLAMWDERLQGYCFGCGPGSLRWRALNPTDSTDGAMQLPEDDSSPSNVADSCAACLLEQGGAAGDPELGHSCGKLAEADQGGAPLDVHVGEAAAAADGDDGTR